MADFVIWMINAKKGESMEYARGNLAAIREETRLLHLEKKPTEPHVKGMLSNANVAFDAYMNGEVALVQRRMGIDDFSYIAQKL
jgi:hypothetical protein